MILRRDRINRMLLWCCTIQEHIPGPIYMVYTFIYMV